MELKTEIKEIDGVKFLITQSPGRAVIRLDKKTTQLLLPAAKSIMSEFKKVNSYLDLDLSSMIGSLEEVLSSMTEDEYEEYVFQMVNDTRAQFTSEKKLKVVELRNVESFDEVFTGRSPLTVYKLLFEIMKVNRFAFFELVGGSGISLTGIFQNLKKKTGKQPDESEVSET